MKSQIKYTREYHWTRSPDVWGLLAKTAAVAFLIGIAVGGKLF